MQHRRRQDKDSEYHGEGLLAHHAVVVDNLNLDTVHEVLEATPDLDLLILFGHCSVGCHSDKCSGADLGDDIAGEETGATSAVGSIGGAESETNDLDFEHLEGGGASESLVGGGVADTYCGDGLHPGNADDHGDVEDDCLVAVHKSLEEGLLVMVPIDEVQ